MIKTLTVKEIKPKRQTGKVYKFNRIAESESEIKKENNIKNL